MASSAAGRWAALGLSLRGVRERWVAAAPQEGSLAAARRGERSGGCGLEL